MSHNHTFRQFLVALSFGVTAALASFATVAADDETIETMHQHPVIVMQTFDVHADAQEFIDMIDRGVKMAKEADPQGGGQIHVLASHVDPAAASQVVIFTTYPSMDAYIANKEAMESDPKLKEFSKKMSERDFVMVHQSVNTLVAEY